jgi:uncharacterized protein
MQHNPQVLIDLITLKMPYGKYKNVIICDIPEYYLNWFNSKGFPEGKIGVLLQTMYEIKLNGLEFLLEPIKKNNGNRQY